MWRQDVEAEYMIQISEEKHVLGLAATRFMSRLFSGSDYQDLVATINGLVRIASDRLFQTPRRSVA